VSDVTRVVKRGMVGAFDTEHHALGPLPYRWRSAL